MTEPFVGEIRILACNFAPNGWAHCDGQLLSISQNSVLFSILGTTFGGDGYTIFGLPDLRGFAPMHAGQGQGLSNRYLGQTDGARTVSLVTAQIPAHTHAAMASTAPGNTSVAAGNTWAAAQIGRTPVRMYAPAGGTPAALSSQAAGPCGGGQPHNNMPPYLVLNFCIALLGTYPIRE